MKILAIMGSPRKGDSFQVTQIIEQTMKSVGDVEFEYLWLKDAHLEFCQGCAVCLYGKGEKFCPIKDDREQIEQAMRNADATIFVSPVYNINVTALMKNFIDRFSYLCHRPVFFDKYSMYVSTHGGFGLPETLSAIDWAARTWGFNKVTTLGVLDTSLRRESSCKKTEAKAKRAAQKFYTAVKNKKKRRAHILNLTCFINQKRLFAATDKGCADYKFWKEKGWFEKDAKYFYPVKISIFKRIIAMILSKLAGFPKELVNSVSLQRSRVRGQTPVNSRDEAVSR